MPFHWTNVWLATAGALVLGLALAYVLAVFEVRVVAFVLLPLLAVPPLILTALRWKSAPPAAVSILAPILAMLSGLPFVALLSARRFRDIDRAFGNAARACGAGEWRVFWRLLLPLGWKTAGLAAALAFARIAAECDIAANL